jgi:hypothetical protein
MMMYQIKLFFLVLSIIYILRFLIELVIKLNQDDAEPITLSKLEQVVQLISLSYIITYFLT